MTYATVNDLIRRFGAAEIAQRSDRAKPRKLTEPLLVDAAAGADLSGYSSEQQAAAAAAIDVLQTALADADDTINAHISPRFTLPISPVPAILARVACNLARRYLYDDQVTDLIKAAYDDDMKLLCAVRDGKAALGVDGATNEAPVSTAGAELVTGERVWRRDNSRGFL